MIWLLGFLITFYGIGWLVMHLLVWIGSGFNFRRTRDELEFMDEMSKERRLQQKRENERVTAEYRAKRKERLGY